VEGGSAFKLVFWVVVLILIVIGAGVALLHYRRRMFDEERNASGPALTLHDLREHRRQGRMTDEEFEAAKAAIIGQTRSAAGPISKSGKDPKNRPSPKKNDPKGGS